MSLSPSNRPTYAKVIRAKLVDLKADGSCAPNLEYFAYCEGLTITNERFQPLLAPPRASRASR